MFRVQDVGTVWKDARPYMSLFYDELYSMVDCYPDSFDKADIKAVLEEYVDTYTEFADNSEWFEHMKSVSQNNGFSPDTKAYKAEPEKYKGHVGDVSTFVRIALTGKANSPDLFEIMKILGKEKVLERLNAQIKDL